MSYAGYYNVIVLSVVAMLGVATVVSKPIDVKARPVGHPSYLYDIRTPAAAKPWEKTAARELDAYLARMTKDRITVSGEARPVFHVGDTPFARSKGLGADTFRDEEWCIRTFGRDVVLAGGGTRGTLYAVSHYLEDVCGVRWWSEYEEDVPAAKPLDLPSADRRGRPVFWLRDIYDTSKTPKTPCCNVFRRRLNGTGGGMIPMDWGGSIYYGPPNACHTIWWYTQGQFKAHPEWKAKPTEKVVYGQLCLSSPGLREFMRKRLFEYVEKGEREAREKGRPAPRLYDISINDDKAVCQCPACKAEHEKYGVSGQYLNFLNPLADELAARHPGLKVTTLAYFFTEDPPKGGVRASDNLVIRLCDTRTNQAQSHFAEGNTLFIGLIEAWKDVAKHITIWDYMTVFNGAHCLEMPYPSEFHLADYLRKAHECHVEGFFVEHEGQHADDMYEMKSWLEAKLFEDPYQDELKLMRVFAEGYYGAAAEPILRFRRNLDETCRAKGGYVSWMPSVGSFAFIGDDLLARGLACFAEAESAVRNDPKRLARVRRARLGVDRIIATRRGLIRHVPGKGVVLSDDSAANAASRRILDFMPGWIARYPDADKLLPGVTNGLVTVSDPAAAVKPPVPDLFANATYYDFPSWKMFWEREKNGKYRDCESLVDDSGSSVGKAIRVNVEKSEHYVPPFTAGVYNAEKLKVVKAVKFDKEPFGEGYRWLEFGRVTLPADGYLYMTGRWTPQVHPAAYPEMAGHTFDVWISARFEGPLYRPGTTEPDRIFIDRVLFVEPQGCESVRPQ